MKKDVILGWLSRLQAQSTPAVVVTTSNVTLTADQLKATGGAIVANVGASGTVIAQLPAAKKGMRVTGMLKAAQLLRIKPFGTETMSLPSTGVQGAAGKGMEADAIGESGVWVCLVAGTWDYLGPIDGTWTAEA